MAAAGSSEEKPPLRREGREEGRRKGGQALPGAAQPPPRTVSGPWPAFVSGLGGGASLGLAAQSRPALPRPRGRVSLAVRGLSLAPGTRMGLGLELGRGPGPESSGGPERSGTEKGFPSARTPREAGLGGGGGAGRPLLGSLVRGFVVMGPVFAANMAEMQKFKVYMILPCSC
uniref:Uncharacterized protein LOC110207458 n=1 Tax=Phascolarctos cinereus TaxID=38626 RepID=A0A6P5K7A6_PHACI|nr:uncharacterized protein LOC110207458 [Phascolarctos cinereus]